ncbi:MAG: glycosyltransferase family 2 protein [Acidimicrobiales bacterium]
MVGADGTIEVEPSAWAAISFAADGFSGGGEDADMAGQNRWVTWCRYEPGPGDGRCGRPHPVLRSASTRGPPGLRRDPGPNRVIDVILPVLDEADALAWVLPRLPDGFRALVVDNGSVDGSPDIARTLGAEVIEASPKGFGSACFAGLQAATSDIVCFMDADASLDPAHLPRVVGPVETGSVALCLGERRADPGAWALHARVANRVLAAELRRRTGLEIRDLGPMRAALRSGLLGLGLRDRRSGWPLEMVLRAHQAGWRISGVEVPLRARSGRSKVTGTVSGTLRAVSDMARLLR